MLPLTQCLFLLYLLFSFSEGVKVVVKFSIVSLGNLTSEEGRHCPSAHIKTDSWKHAEGQPEGSRVKCLLGTYVNGQPAMAVTSNLEVKTHSGPLSHCSCGPSVEWIWSEVWTLGNISRKEAF